MVGVSSREGNGSQKRHCSSISSDDGRKLVDKSRSAILTDLDILDCPICYHALKIPVFQVLFWWFYWSFVRYIIWLLMTIHWLYIFSVKMGIWPVLLAVPNWGINVLHVLCLLDTFAVEQWREFLNQSWSHADTQI